MVEKMKIAKLTHNLGGGIEHHIFLESLLQPQHEHFKIQFQYGVVKVSKFLESREMFEETSRIDSLHGLASFLEDFDQIEIHSVFGWEEIWLWVVANLAHGNMLFIFHDYSLFTKNSHLLISRFGEWLPQVTRNLTNVEESLLVNSVKLLAPSHDTATRVANFLKMKVETMVVHEVKESKLNLFKRSHHVNESSLFNVVIPGHMAVQKGSFMLKRCVDLSEALKLPLAFTVLGRDLEHNFNREKVRFIGGYSQGDLPNLLIRLKPDVFWWPTNGAETFSYTLSELMRTNLTLCVPNRGSFPERVKTLQNAKIVKEPDVAFSHVSTILEAIEN